MKYKKILAIKLRALGDTVLLTAPLKELRAAFPESEIHVAVTDRWASVLENHPAVDRIWSYHRHESRVARAKNIARFGFRLRQEKYDCVVNFHASPSSSLLAFATGAPVRSVHFHGARDRNRYSTVEISGKGVVKPIIERDMDALRALGLEIPTACTPRVFLSDAELNWARSTLTDLGFRTPLLALGIGASRPTKIWPVENYALVAVEWLTKTGGSVAVITAPEEAHVVRSFFEVLPNILKTKVPDENEQKDFFKEIKNFNWLNLRQLAALLSLSRVYVGNDSGPKHLAVATDTPSLTIVGPEHPFEWHPYPVDRHPFLFIEGLQCRKDQLPGLPPWCGLNECTLEKHRCMSLVTVQNVLKRLPLSGPTFK